MADYASFRQRLDAALRTRDVQQVKAFLIAENQWSSDVPSDPEFAMWLMIAGTPTLKELHTEARHWLVTHGHEEAAEAVLRRTQGSTKQQSGQHGARQQQHSGQGKTKTSTPQSKKTS
jgi:hypothetical protein